MDIILINDDKYVCKQINNEIYIINTNTGFTYSNQIKIKTILWESNNNIYKCSNVDSYHDIPNKILKMLIKIIKYNNIYGYYEIIN